MAANFALIPRFGMLGAAWATVLAYAVMAGLGFCISQRLYPIPFETGRLAGLGALAGLGYAAGRWAPAALWPAVAFKAAVLAVFAAVAYAIVRRPRRDDQEGLTPPRP